MPITTEKAIETLQQMLDLLFDGCSPEKEALAMAIAGLEAQAELGAT